MDIARILVRTTCTNVLNESFSVRINGTIFRIKLSEDSHGPIRINLFQKSRRLEGSLSSSDFDFNWNSNEIVNVEEGESSSATQVSNSFKGVVAAQKVCMGRCKDKGQSE